MTKIITYSKLILFPLILSLVSIILFISFMCIDAADVDSLFGLSKPLNEIKPDQYGNQYVEYCFENLLVPYNEKYFFNNKGERKSKYRDYLFYLDEAGYMGVRIYAKDYNKLSSNEGLLLQGRITQMTKIEVMNFELKLSKFSKSKKYPFTLYYIDTAPDTYFTPSNRFMFLCMGGICIIFAIWLLYDYIVKQDNHFTIKQYLSIHPEHNEKLEHFYKETVPVANIRMDKKWFLYFTVKESLLDLSENILWIHYSFMIETIWNIVPVKRSFLSVHTKNGRNMNIKIKNKSEYKEIEEYMLAMNPELVSGFTPKRYYLYMENPRNFNRQTAGKGSGEMYLPDYPYAEWNKDSNLKKKVNKTLY